MERGFKRLMSSPVMFYHADRDLVCVVHGDDFVFVGVDEDLDFALESLKSEYELKDRGRLGSGEHDIKEIDMLGRKISYHEWGITWEGDERHRDSVLEYFGTSEGSKPLKKTGCKTKRVEEAEGGA